MIHRRIAGIVAHVSLVVLLTALGDWVVYADELAASMAKLQPLDEEGDAPAKGDWLVVPVLKKAGVYRGKRARDRDDQWAYQARVAACP